MSEKISLDSSESVRQTRSTSCAFAGITPPIKTNTKRHLHKYCHFFVMSIVTAYHSVVYNIRF